MAAAVKAIQWLWLQPFFLLFSLFIANDPCVAFAPPLIRAPHKRLLVFSPPRARAGGVAPFSPTGPADDEDGWQPNDFEQDCENLERAIRLLGSNNQLRAEQNVDLMEHFCAERKRVDVGLIRFLRTQVLGSFLVAAGLPLLGASPLGGAAADLFRVGLSIHYFFCVVLPPIVLLFLFSTVFKSKNTRTDNVDDYGNKYYTFFTRHEDPKTSCRNFATCLTHQWLSAIVGLALFVRPHGYARIGGRLAVWAALHQYPEQWRDVWNKKQPLPLSFSTRAMQFCTSCLCTRWMIAIEVACLLAYHRLPRNMLLAAYGSFAGVCLALAALAATHRSAATQWVMDRGYILRSMVRAVVLVKLWRFVSSSHQQWAVSIVAACQKPFFPLSWRGIARSVRLALGVVGPICHGIAALRLFRVNAMPDISLARLSDVEQEKPDRIVYYRKWRKPQLVLRTLQQWKDASLHWFFLKGQVLEKINYPERYEGDETMLRLERIMESDAIPWQNRSEWKELASNQTAERHKLNYAAGKIEEDPLGIFVQDIFDIGLSYDFDHMAPNGTMSSPTPELLQSRAAKSALERVYELRHANTANELVDSVDSVTAKNKRRREMRAETEEEVKRIARRLYELVPEHRVTDHHLPSATQIYKRVGPAEYILVSDPAAAARDRDRHSPWTRSGSRAGNDARNKGASGSSWGEELYVNSTRGSKGYSGNASLVDDIDYLNPGGEPYEKKLVEAWIEEGNDGAAGGSGYSGNASLMDDVDYLNRGGEPYEKKLVEAWMEERNDGGGSWWEELYVNRTRSGYYSGNASLVDDVNPGGEPNDNEFVEAWIKERNDTGGNSSSNDERVFLA